MVKIIAHRGASVEEPENTLASIARALELGVDYIEIDVQLSQDGVPVVLHDNTLCRTTNAPPVHHVRQTASSKIKHFDAGSWFHGVDTLHRIPTLEEVLALDFGSTGLMIEIKDDQNHDLSSAVFQLLKENFVKKFVIGSFSPESLAYFHGQFPLLDLIGIIDGFENANLFHKLNIRKLAVDHEAVQAEEFRELSRQFEELWAYSVDDKRRADELAALGVRGIITNDPRRCLVDQSS
jgi:glycerophosphoryl diester phosphodiesterase